MGNADTKQAAAPSNENLAKYNWEEIKKHNKKGDAWIVVKKRVYNVTKFLSEHPGGDDIILEVAGKDATANHGDANHSSDAIDMMKDFLIGVLEE